MINSKELRIGNMVMFMGREIFVHGGTIQDLERDNAVQSQYKPIPLTTEILERCNMKKRFDNIDCNIWDSIEEPPTRNKVFSLALLTQGWVYLAAPGAQSFQYVHQLQNLYYALTQKEIEITL